MKKILFFILTLVFVACSSGDGDNSIDSPNINPDIVGTWFATTLDSDDQYTGPKASPRGQKAGVMDDDPFGGTSGTTGESSKIVCTMMNESYGFGNFRNKIWLKHSKDLPKEYEKGYHKIFLPLVKFAKGQGKLNKAVKKTLEHVARHRTLDLKQEMKGKTHLLGRIYRKILEPICFIVGKVSNNV